MSYAWEEYGDSYEPDSNGPRGQNWVKPLPGTYLAEIVEGVELRHNEKTGKFSIKVPFKLIGAIKECDDPGDTKAEGAEVADFISPSHEFTMKRLGFLISASKYRADFTKKYSGIPSYGEPEFDTFVMDVKRYLPSTRVVLTLAMATGTTKPMINIRSYHKVNTGASQQQDTTQRPGW